LGDVGNGGSSLNLRSSGQSVSINKVALRRAQLLLGWVTVCGQVNHLGI